MGFLNMTMNFQVPPQEENFLNSYVTADFPGRPVLCAVSYICVHLCEKRQSTQISSKAMQKHHLCGQPRYILNPPYKFCE